MMMMRGTDSSLEIGVDAQTAGDFVGLGVGEDGCANRVSSDIAQITFRTRSISIARDVPCITLHA
jgi:hypothetical protein